MATEVQLKSDMKENPPAKFPYLVAEEWEVGPRRSDQGVGDLVFANWDLTEYLVVEVKARNDQTGPTACKARNRARNKVIQQLEVYMKAWAKKYPEADVYGQTNFGGELGKIKGPYPVMSDSTEYGDRIKPQSNYLSSSFNTNPVRQINLRQESEPVSVGRDSSSSFNTNLGAAVVAGGLVALAGAWLFGGQEPEENKDDNGRRRV
ncbi:hypothetical protein DFS34DRAFT_651233 [Phlyctochytrium arcticum]|nr:hypothetical protein DFS34DRAFT_651233 [Phlyctochytrium arcticum]